MTPGDLTDKAMRLRAEIKEPLTFAELVGEDPDIETVARLWLVMVEWKISAGAVEKAIADHLTGLLEANGKGLEVDGHAVFLGRGTKRETCIDEPGFFDWLRANPDQLDRILNPNTVKKGSLPPAARSTFFEESMEPKPSAVQAVPVEVLEANRQKRALS